MFQRLIVPWLGLVAALAMPSGDAASQAVRLPVSQCKAVAVAMGQVFEALPRDTLSLPFRQSATGFVRTGLDCPIGHRIEITSDADARALDDVVAMLLAQTPPIDLKASLDIVDLSKPKSG